MGNVIKIENITKSYGTKVQTQVLFGIDLVIEDGEFCAIIGQSGSGKSTLLNIIGSLDAQTSGNVYINGSDIAKLNDQGLATLRNETLGFIFQFHHLLPEFSVLENVLMPYAIKNKNLSKKNKERATELLEVVGMDKYINSNANDLSGGQKQRVAIARALMNNPKIILADEPTGNLDSVSRTEVYNLFRQINEKFNTTIVLITHDATIAKNADRIIEISDGKIVADTKHNI